MKLDYRWFCVAAALVVTGCPKTADKPPCDQASLAKLLASCKKDECHKLITEREKTCGERIIEQYQDAGVAGSTGGMGQ